MGGCLNPPASEIRFPVWEAFFLTSASLLFLPNMSGSLWARFQKTESDKGSLDRDVREKQSGQDGVEVAEVGPGGLSFEEGTLVRSFVTLLLDRTCFMFEQTLLEGLAVISALPHARFSSSDASSALASSRHHPRF